MTEALLMSLPEPAAPAAPNLIFGVLCLIIGVVVVRNRARIHRATVRTERRWFGKGFGEFAQRLQRPFGVGAAGVFCVLIGVAMVTYAVVRFFSPSAP